jgi:3',5'-cyclic AMP phosphodiesterase CpdA
VNRLRPLAAVALVATLFAACGQRDARLPLERALSRSTPAAAAATAPTAVTTPEPVRSGFVAFGDFGGGTGQARVARAMEQWALTHRVDALVTTGDNVYPTGSPALFGAQLDEPYRALRATRPLWATLGNHDVAARHGADQLAHLGLPRLPYAKELPGAQLLFLDANHPDAAQASWLDRALTRPGPLFRIVVFHQPAWSCGPHGSTAGVDAAWVPILEAHRVALVLNGHDHDYERFTSPLGVTYVVTGGGGQTLYPVLPFCRGTPTEEAHSVRHHFTGVEIGADSLTLTAVADDGTVLDRAVLRR